eukprot:Hpha_TRINITY_DN29771_c0_g1::TRINITY_DN29771_c0_g1_i1::g.2654::m.2654
MAGPLPPLQRPPAGHPPRWLTAAVDRVRLRNELIKDWAMSYVPRPGQICGYVKKSSSSYTAAPTSGGLGSPSSRMRSPSRRRQRHVCSRCRAMLEEAEGLELMCGQDDHWHCQNCLIDMGLKSLRRLRCRRFFARDELLRVLLPGLVQCARCRHPSMLLIRAREVLWAELLSSVGVEVCRTGPQPSPGDQYTPFRTSFVVAVEVDRDATNALQYHVDSIYENERRSFLGRFGSENLWVTDFRGNWSTEEGQPRKAGRRGINLPNSAYHWMENWAVGVGWRYATAWPGGFVAGLLNGQWQREATPWTFVRRRKWLRLRLRLSDDDVAGLALAKEGSAADQVSTWLLLEQAREGEDESEDEAYLACA